jgi:hypothetical protein
MTGRTNKPWMAGVCLICSAVLFTASIAMTQPAPARPDPEGDLLTFFYKDPRPERLIGYLDRYETSQGSQDWITYPPVAGFLAVIFRSHADQADRLVPVRPGPRMAATLSAALTLSGNQTLAAKLRPTLDEARSDEKLKSEFAGLPGRLEDLRARSGTHLDILWGAAFASGDDTFVRMIADVLAQTANRSELIALDVARTALAIMGGPKEIMGQLRGKYGDDGAREVIFAATALWGLQSNARQHQFVGRAVVKYIEDHSGTPAVKALTAATQRPKSK